MGTKRMMWLVASALAVVLLLASCNSVGVYRVRGRGPGIGHGPPAHAQAHGYRRQQIGGYDLIYDSALGVYVVMGLSDCYYHNGHFYRLHGDIWQVSLRADTDWRVAAHDALPSGLRLKVKPVGAVRAGGKTNALIKTTGAGQGKGNNKAKGAGKGKK
jgi:hypothetical protein